MSKITRELRSALSQPTLSPILIHLNADSSWCILLPFPSTDAQPSGRRFFSLIIDPWLKGPQSDVTPLLSKQSHSIPSAYQTLKEVEQLVWEIEELVNPEVAAGSHAVSEGGKAKFDAVCIQHEFTDHCHRETLEELSTSVPVFAASKAAALIRSWKHFDVVSEPPSFDGVWPLLNPQKNLPPWMSITKLFDPENALYYHSATLITFLPSSNSEDNTPKPQTIVYTPHGILPTLAAPLASHSVLLLIHGLHDIKLASKQLNLGGNNGLALFKALKAKYWVGTHDEEKKAGGIVKWFLRRDRVDVKEAVRKSNGGALAEGEDVMPYKEMANGEALALV